MPNPSQPNPPPGGGDQPPAAAGDAPASLGFEESLRQFWERNRGFILGICLVILLVIAGRTGWQAWQERRAAATAAAYAAAATDEQLQAFAREHADSALAGVAQLRVADGAYEAGRYDEAVSAYEQARRELPAGPLAGRARLGQGISMLRNGQIDAGRQALQQLANDVGAPGTLRAEAAYHLASLAADSGAADDVGRLTDQINAIDPGGLWAQRATMLREQLAPAPAAEEGATDQSGSVADEEPTVSFPGAKS